MLLVVSFPASKQRTSAKVSPTVKMMRRSADTAVDNLVLQRATTDGAVQIVVSAAFSLIGKLDVATLLQA